MDFSSLVNIPYPTRNKKGDNYAAGDGGGTAPTFLTAQALVSFPVAATLITVVWQVIRAIAPVVGEALWLPAMISALVGALIYRITGADPQTVLPKDPWVRYGVAAINTLYLFVASTGIVPLVRTATGG